MLTRKPTAIHRRPRIDLHFLTPLNRELMQDSGLIWSGISPGQLLDIKGSLECKWVAWCHCQIISSCTHMPSTHSAPLCYFNIGQMSEPQYQLFQMWISLESNSGKTWDSATAQIKELFSHKNPCASLFSFIVGYEGVVVVYGRAWMLDNCRHDGAEA